MKLKVKPEGREGIWLVEKSDLKEWIAEQRFEKIHNYVNTGGIVIGADHDVESVLSDIDRADRLAVLTGDAQRGNFGHALSLITNEKMEMYDIGKITEDILVILEGEKI